MWLSDSKLIKTFDEICVEFSPKMTADILLFINAISKTDVQSADTVQWPSLLAKNAENNNIRNKTITTDGGQQ